LVRQNATLADQVRRLTPSVTMIGSSESLSRIRDVVRRVAASDVTLLITGESGTGKELVADDLIKSSNRTAKPFVKINCAALPETLLESELFGHERGAFTGAVSRQIGKFEMADGGSLFLDEVGEMSMTTQTKLLRIIQEKTFQRLGGHENIQVDVRLIAATNKDLLKEIRAGNFREDLYYRLNVIEVELPPLRERADDIPPLLEHFVRYFAEKHGKEPAKISSGAKRKLSQFSWPGNIRQLKNYVERITLLDLGKDLDADVNVLVGNSGVGKSVNAGLDFGGRFDHIVSLDEAEALYIRRVLEETKGNRTHAAQILKIDPKTLRAKLKKAKSVGITSDGE